MLTNVNYHRFVCHDKATLRGRYEFLIDDDHLGPLIWEGLELGYGFGAAIIDCYEALGLHAEVASNLIRAFLIISNRSGSPISLIVEQNRQHNPRFHLYADAVVAHFLLL